MNKNAWANVGGINLPKCLLLCSILLLLVVPVFGADVTNLNPNDTTRINQTYKLSNDASTPFNVWAGAIVLGIVLIVLSFVKFPNGEEGLVSIMAWIPIAFAMYTSFSVERLTSAGMVGITGGASNEYLLLENHTVYHWDVIGIALFILLMFAIGNTYRIYVSQKTLGEVSRPDKEEQFV